LVGTNDINKLDASQYEKSASGHIFVKSTTRKGILPQILDELLVARKRTKKDCTKWSSISFKSISKLCLRFYWCKCWTASMFTNRC
jgi:DNA polymerase elongation subunit (family B)